MEKSNVVNVPPRRYQVNYKGLHGWVEYRPSDKSWHWSLKLQMTIRNEGKENSREKAELELKKVMDVTASSKNVRSID